MTEAEWITCSDPQKMLASLDQRQKGFFACACVRRVWHLVQEESGRTAVAVAEQYLLGTGTKRGVRRAADAARDVYVHDLDVTSRADAAAVNAADAVAANGRYAASYSSDDAAEAATNSDAARETQANLVRDVANPFRPVTVNTAWRTPAVVALAEAAYDYRTLPAGTLEPDRLAILADALEEAGCDDVEILSHLREPAEHVLGCWAIDLLLWRG